MAHPCVFCADDCYLHCTGRNFGRYVDSISGKWTAAQREVGIHVGGRPCDGAQRAKGEDGVVQCAATPQVVGLKDVNITVAGQTSSSTNVLLFHRDVVVVVWLESLLELVTPVPTTCASCYRWGGACFCARVVTLVAVGRGRCPVCVLCCVSADSSVLFACGPDHWGQVGEVCLA